MAVVADADVVDRALDYLARLYGKRAAAAARHEYVPLAESALDIADRLIVAATIAALWELVAEHALAVGDSELLRIASCEYEHARAAFRSLDPP